jgi:outer membrane protein TolC
LEVINDVLANNLFLQSSQKDVELKEKDIKAAWTNYLPNIAAGASVSHIDPDLAEISGGSNPEFSTDGTIKLSQTLFSAEANTGINTQKDFLESQKEIYKADQLNTIFEASNAYFNALILKRNLQINATNLELTKKNHEVAKQNYEAGLSGKSDELRFRSELANDMQLLVESANALDQAFFALNQVLNNPIDYNIDVDEVELEKGLFEQYNYMQLRELLDDPLLIRPLINFLIEEARVNAPELKSLEYDISATGRKIKLNSEGRLLPVLALQGQYNYNFNEWGVGVDPNILVDNYRIGLNLSIPLVDQNRRNVNQQIGRIQMEQLDIIKSNTNLNIETNVNNAVVGLINKVSLIELSKVSETSAKEALELTQISYSEGAVNIVQLLDAQNNYLNASLARATAVYDYLLASLQLERFIGYYFLLHTKAQNDEFITRFAQYMENNNNR